jgi:hypothetical protein
MRRHKWNSDDYPEVQLSVTTEFFEALGEGRGPQFDADWLDVAREEIFRLVDELLAERERCALVCEKAFFAYRREAGIASTGLSPQDGATWRARADVASEMARQIRHPTAPASDTDPGPAGR